MANIFTVLTLSIHIAAAPKAIFSPPPGAEVLLDKAAITNFRINKADAVKGYIEVNPLPAKVCFTITTNEARSDVRVCKKQSVPFYDYDIDPMGKVTWKVKQGPLDTGLNYTWQTPYRMARFARFTEDIKDAHDELVIDCQYESTEAMGRRVRATLMDGTQWVIRFPTQDIKAPIPAPMRSLLDNDKEEKAQASKENKDSKTQDKKQVEVEKKVAIEPQKLRALPDPWEITGKFGFEMGADYFVGGESSPAGNQKGQCRYTYRGWDVAAPALECRHVGNFRWVYVPLTCLKEPSA